MLIIIGRRIFFRLEISAEPVLSEHGWHLPLKSRFVDRSKIRLWTKNEFMIFKILDITMFFIKFASQIFFQENYWNLPDPLPIKFTTQSFATFFVHVGFPRGCFELNLLPHGYGWHCILDCAWKIVVKTPATQENQLSNVNAVYTTIFSSQLFLRRFLSEKLNS